MFTRHVSQESHTGGSSYAQQALALVKKFTDQTPSAEPEELEDSSEDSDDPKRARDARSVTSDSSGTLSSVKGGATPQI